MCNEIPKVKMLKKFAWRILAANIYIRRKPVVKITLVKRWIEPTLEITFTTLKKYWKCKLDESNFSDNETRLILRCESPQPQLNVKPTLKRC